ncbi:MAG: hypothetical protein RIR33_2272 [Pseudomonadota bacterium]|jgi:hypothetical protein
MLKPHFCLVAAIALAACVQPPAPIPDTAPVILSGEITRDDHQTYREIPFTVPRGTQRITFDFAYTGKDNRTVIDIGVRDPEGQRGWSGGNKSSFTIGADTATPSYRSGPIQPGEWKLVLGIPNIREGQTASYTATIRFTPEAPARRSAPPAYKPSVLSTEPGWFRGDLHTHTAHSDGSCDVDGARAPCPAIKTISAARDASLDFLAITDHNTISQIVDMAATQPQFPKTLLIPGTEVTTFTGHANVIGNTEFLDFQLGSPRLPTLARLIDQVEAQGAFISVNHPSLPSGEACMGCGWTVKDTDWSRISAIEVINGASMRNSGPEGAFNGIAFWDRLLKEGHRLTAIAGSDNHDATDARGARQSPVGTPATVVYADQLSSQGIIAGVKSGRVFIDVAGLPSASLDARATAGRSVTMGDELELAPGQGATIMITWSDLPAAARLHLVAHNVTVDGRTAISPPPSRPGTRLEASSARLDPSALRGYLRAEIRDASGKLLLLGNPIYFRRAG